MEPANDCAFVTLITSDSYVEGAITLAYSIRAVHISTHDTIVLVPPNTLSAAPLARLYRAFHKVVYIPILKSGSAYNDAKHLQLLGRPELDVTYTKIHVFNPDILPGYDRIMFLDADTVLLKNVDVAFNMLDHADFVAAADVGWPDIFNSGVFLARPSKEVYDAIVWDAKYSGSFDGGDQGLLNAFFNTWAGYDHSFYADGPVAGVDGSEPRPYCSPSKKRTARLPFIYNVTPSAVYSYMPAFNQFKKHIAIVHFAGHTKPWNQKRFTDGSVWNSSLTADAADMHGAWWSIYDSLVSRWNVEDQQKNALQQNSTEQNSSSNSENFPNASSSSSSPLHYTWDEKELPFKRHPTDYEWSKKELNVITTSNHPDDMLAANNISRVMTQTKKTTTTKTSPTSSNATITRITTTTITTTTTTTTTTTSAAAAASGPNSAGFTDIPTSRTVSSRGRRSTTTTTSPMKIFEVISSSSSSPTTFQDPRLHPSPNAPPPTPSTPQAQEYNYVSPSRSNSATSSSHRTSIGASHSNATSPTRYEWNMDEFTKAQRKRSQHNLPIMKAPSLSNSRSPSVSGSVVPPPSVSAAKKESTESLFDEEGYSLKPVKKQE